MSFFDRLSNGWTIAMSSFKVLREKKQLIIFPILSGMSVLLIIGSIVVSVLAANGWQSGPLDEINTPVYYIYVFIFYVVNYFIIIFFNMALVHCTHLYFKGEEVTVRAGLQFSVSRIGAIFSWAIFAATVGLILRIIQENVGWIGKIITGLVGIVWSIATFFVVPIIAYENVGPIEAFKRSSNLMKQKWGESLSATFSLGLVQFIGILIVGIPLFFLGTVIHPIAGVAFAIAGGFLVVSIVSAAETIFISAVYHNINGDVTKHVDQQMVDDLFKKKSGSWFNN